MVKRRSLNQPGDVQVVHLLEKGTLKSLQQAKKHFTQLKQLHWDHYNELARQREEIRPLIHEALNESCTSNFKFGCWQRAVKYKYSLHPLSALGSLAMPGGRFNIGDLNSNIPSFPALYIAVDKDTALQETLSQVRTKEKRLTPQEVALTNPISQSHVSVSGSLERIFDLRSSANLRKFVALIKNFKLSNQLLARAKKLGEPIGTIHRPTQLRETLLTESWSAIPSLYDTPANPQIFGQLLSLAGIEGVLYPSKFTKKDCLAIFTRNFANSSSFIELDDEAPDERVPLKISSSNWRICEMPIEDVFDLRSHH